MSALAGQLYDAMVDGFAERRTRKQGKPRIPLQLGQTSDQWHRERNRFCDDMGNTPHRPMAKAALRIVPHSRARSYGMQIFNIKGVVEALLEEEYDPTVEVVRILKGETDPETGEHRHLVPADVRLRFAAELMKFIHPTKKAVEVEDKTPPRGAELDGRLSQLIARANRLGIMNQAAIEEAVRDEYGPHATPSGLDML